MPINEYEDLLAELQPTPGKNQVDEYDRLAGEIFSPQKPALQNSMFRAVATDPDTRARAMKIADQAKLPVEYVERNFDKLSRDMQVEATDYDRIIKTSPTVSKWLENPDNMAVSRDDIDALSRIESTTQNYSMLKGLYKSVQYGMANVYEGLAKAPALISDVGAAVHNKFFPGELSIKTPELYRENFFTRALEEAKAANKTPELDMSITEQIGKGNYAQAGKVLANQFVANAPTQTVILLSAMMGAPEVGGLFAGTSTAATSHDENLKKGIPVEQSLAPSVIKGGIEAAFEQLGTLGMFKKWDNKISSFYGKQVSKEVIGDFFKTLAYSMAAEGNEELLTSVAQDLTDYVTGVNPKALEGIFQRGLDAGLLGASSGGLMTAPTASLAGVSRLQMAQQVKLQQEFLSALGESAGATKLKERLPEKQKELVEQITKGTPVENIFIPLEAAETYFQSKNVSIAKAMTDLGILEQYETAKQIGAPLQIPLSTAVDKMVGTEHWSGLLNDIKFHEKELTANELKKALQEEANKVDVQPSPEEERHRSEHQQIVDDIRQKLEAAGRSKTESETLAKLYAERYQARAQRLDMGKTALQLYQEDGPRIQQMVLEQAMGTMDDGTMLGLNQPPLKGQRWARRTEKDQTSVETFPSTLRIVNKTNHTAVSKTSKQEALRVLKPGRFFNPHTKFVIEVDEDTATKAHSQSKIIERKSTTAAKNHIELLQHLGDVIKNAIYVADDTDRKEHGGDFLVFFAPISIKGKQHMVKLQVLKDKKGYRVYNYAVVDRASGGRVLNPPAKSGAIPTGEVTLDQFEKEINALRDKYSFFQSPIDIAPAFYSKLQKVIEEKMGNSATIDQVRAMMKDIKEEERKWSGIDEFLKGKTKVSKSEMLDFLRGNQLEIKEVVRGDKSGVTVQMGAKTYTVFSPDGEGVGEFLGEFEAQRAAREMSEEDNGREYTVEQTEWDGESTLEDVQGDNEGSPTKFSKYTLPGGENYREVLFTLPAERKEPLPSFVDWMDEKGFTSSQAFEESSKKGPLFREYEQLQKKEEDETSNTFYRSSHWDEPNVLAHVRLNDRTDADGKKVLFVEEIQSDWHQEGRKKGYKGEFADDPALTKAREDALKAADDFDAALIEKYKAERVFTVKDLKKDGDTYSGKLSPHLEINIKREGSMYEIELNGQWVGRRKTQAEINNDILEPLTRGETGNSMYDIFHIISEEDASKREQLRSDFVVANDAVGELKRKHESQVPDAPFKKTWHEFALKRIIRMAAEGGYDRIAWTTGEQQAERYDLTKKVGSIDYKANGDGTYEIGVSDKAERESLYQSDAATLDDIEKNLGKEIAEKIQKGDGQPGGGRNTLRGKDLVLEHKGMKGFYDKMLPDFLNKFGKKYGTKVGETEVDAGHEPVAIDEDQPDLAIGTDTDENGNRVFQVYRTNTGTIEEMFETRAEAQGYIDRHFKPPAGMAPAHSLDLTPELKKAALTEGFSLFQDSEGGPRGRISFGLLNALIELGQTADASTFIHETGHLWLNEMAHDIATVMVIPEAERTEKQKKLINDGNTILEWLGVDSWEAIGREQHEQWARGFEAYAMEGKSPSEKLRKAFARFRVWLTSIYKSVSNLGVILTPEIRGVMDRMVATEEQIAQAETQVEPLFEDPWKFGFTGEKAEAYIRARNDAKQAAEEELNRKLMKEYLRAQTEWWKDEREKVRAGFEAQVNNEPIQRVISILQKNTNPDGTPTNAQPIKLSKDALVQMLGKDILKKLPRGVMDAKDGLHPDIVASMLGYESGAVMVDQMTKAPNRVQEIERLTDEKMRELHPDLLHSTNLPQEAIKAVHNEERSTLLKMELEHLASNDIGVLKNVIKKVARVVPTDKSIKDQAKKTIGAKKVTDLSPRIYQAAEAKAAREAGELLAKGDLDGAFQAKQRQWLAHEMYRAAIEAQESMDKFMELAKKIARKDADLSKSRDIDLVSAARAILAAHSIGKTEKTAAEFLEPIRRYDPDTYETVAALVLSVTKNPMPYQEMSFDDFTAMKEAVEAIWELSRTNRQMEIDGEKRDRNDVKMELQSRVVELSSGDKRKGYDKKVSEWDKAIIGFMGVRAALRRVESWVDAMDGGDANGVFRRYIWNPISEAVTEYRTQKKVHIRKYKQIIEAHEWDAKPILSPELGYTFDGKAELLGAMLHTGNESNFQKLLRGRGWGMLDLDGNLDRSKWDTFIDRLQKEGVLKKEDYDFLQSIWDLNEELKPLAQKAHKQMYGYYFNEVTADELKTPYGNYRGGYVPAIADSFMATDQAAREEKESLEKSNNSFMFPTAGRGFTKSRVEGYAAPLVIDIRRIPSHIDKLLRFVYIEPRVKEVSRMLWDKEFRKAMDDFDSTVVGDMLIPWLQRSAQQMVSVPAKGNAGKAGDRFFKFLRRNVGLQAMFANVTNTAQQFTGLTIAGLKVKPRYLNDALWLYFRNPTETAEKITEKSKFMATRMTPQAAELMQQADDILLNPTKAEKAKDWAIQHGYFLQSMAQNVVDTITWMGAYNEAIENGADEKSAVRQADAAVRQTQGSMNPEDISRYEAGPALARLFTMFYSYFNMQANLLGTEFLKIHRDMGLKKGAGKALYIYTMGFMLPAVISEVIVKAMSGKFDEDDDDEYIDDFFGMFFSSQFRSAAALVPIAGQLATAAINVFNDKWYDDRISTSPAVAMIESAAAAPHSVYAAAFGDGNRKKAIRDSLTLLGLVTGLPLAPLAKPAGYLSDYADRKARPTGPIDFTRGLITGKSGR